jgi:sugar (pentulose or hexulose) kinase
MITEAMIKPLPENSVQRIHCIGGESQNRMLMQIKAAVLKPSITTLEYDGRLSALELPLLGWDGSGVVQESGRSAREV